MGVPGRKGLRRRLIISARFACLASALGNGKWSLASGPHGARMDGIGFGARGAGDSVRLMHISMHSRYSNRQPDS